MNMQSVELLERCSCKSVQEMGKFIYTHANTAGCEGCVPRAHFIIKTTLGRLTRCPFGTYRLSYRGPASGGKKTLLALAPAEVESETHQLSVPGIFGRLLNIDRDIVRLGSK